jgi:hypothetical protein
VSFINLIFDVCVLFTIANVLKYMHICVFKNRGDIIDRSDKKYVQVVDDNEPDDKDEDKPKPGKVSDSLQFHAQSPLSFSF